MAEQKRQIKKSRIKYIVIIIILLAVAVAGVFLFLWVRGENENVQEDDAETGTLYSSSRYFCRIRYPEKWDVEAGENGFFMDKASGKIFRLYPYTEEIPDYGIDTSSASPAAATPEPIKVPVADVNIYVHYVENPNFEWPEITPTPAGMTPSPRPRVTPEPTPTIKPYPINEACAGAVLLLRETIAAEGGTGLAMEQGKDYDSPHCHFKKFLYQYTNAEGELMTGDLYVCSRAISYYFIRYETIDAKFNDFRPIANDIIDTFHFSIFDF